MNEVEIGNLLDETESYVHEVLRLHLKEAVRSVMSIRIENRKAVVVFADAAAAAKAVKELSKKMQKRGKQLTAILRAQPAAPTPTTPVATFASTGLSPSVPVLEAIPKANPNPLPVVTVTQESLAPFEWDLLDRRRCPPYHFVPIEPGQAISDGPVFHDQLAATSINENPGSLTGVMQCNLTALTPLLAANDQYEICRAIPAIQDTFQRLVSMRHPDGPNQNVIYVDTPTGQEQIQIRKSKKILEPLRLPEDHFGAVLIPGATIKGMLRASLGALLSAPLERVQERQFSYRPNLKFSSDDGRLSSRAGMVSRVLSDGSLMIRAMDNLNAVWYVCAGAIPPLLRAMNLPTEADLAALLERLNNAATDSEFNLILQRLSLKNNVAGCEKIYNRVDAGAGSVYMGDVNSPRYLLRYRPGSDGEGILSQIFGKRNPLQVGRIYHWVLVRFPNQIETFTIPADVVRHWRATLEHLRDREVGHLLQHPLLEEPDIVRVQQALCRLLRNGGRRGDIVFFDQLNQSPHTVTSMGHHFRYRWSYRDTIHRSALNQERNIEPPKHGRPDLRSVLCPRAMEQQLDSNNRPIGLSGARLLFGYVSTSENEYATDQPLTFGIGARPGVQRSDFSQLAGRVAINCALEQINNRKETQRFLNADHDFLVPLRALGSPKPSAVEHYLSQDRLGHRPDAGILCTYGDTGGDVSAGGLRGRKFYLHQPNAASDPTCYELYARSTNVQTEDRDMLGSDQASIGRFVSTEGTTFRFTLRFTNLRRWELGALLFALSPTRADLDILARILNRSELRSWLDSVGADLRLAHKLGHGRPLGLGSVEVKVEQWSLLRVDANQLPQMEKVKERSPVNSRAGLIEAFAVWLTQQNNFNPATWTDRILLPWLKVHRYITRADVRYPRAGNPSTIFTYHTDLRAKHAAGRKCVRPETRPRQGLRDIM